MKRLAVFASGSGTNAENLIRYFKRSGTAEVVIILSNKQDAFALERARNNGVETLVFSRSEFYDGTFILGRLQQERIDLIVLAGFLWLVPLSLITSFPNRIINIHPALLPSYGGKGMYGSRVHQAVIDNNEKESGITIHVIDEEYDKGKVLCQERCDVIENDTPASLAARIHELEYTYFPVIVEKYLDQI